MEISIHDNQLISYSVNAETSEIVVLTTYEDGKKVERTEVLFRNVITYDCDFDTFGTILFDIEECEPDHIVQSHADLFERGESYGWPSTWNPKTGSLLEHLKSNSVRGFEVSSSIGPSGWVLAKSMQKRSF